MYVVVYPLAILLTLLLQLIESHFTGKAAPKKRPGDDDDGRKEDAKYGFISRQEAEERNRRETLDFNIGKAKYDALIDKKVCGCLSWCLCILL